MIIRPTQEQFETIFAGRDTKYKIPFNQRSYKWKHNESAEEYFLDIFKAWKDGEDSYFVGPYVLLQKISNRREYEIIDGQQRFVATTILLSVIRKIANTYLADPEYDLFSNIEIDETDSEK
jgi:uncharacterized protein with ParB-like and HNH nuclease domain